MEMTTTQRVDVERLREVLAMASKADKWRCTGDAMRCHDGNGCVCAMTGVSRPGWEGDALELFREQVPVMLLHMEEQAERLAMADHMAANTQGYLQSRESELANEKLCSDDLALRLIEAQEERDSLRRQRDAAESKLAERDAEIARLGEELDVANTALGQATTDCVEASFRAEAAERAREESVELMREVLERDRVRYLNGECVCINHSRKAELEYESGTCPHQRIAAFLAANGGGRED